MDTIHYLYLHYVDITIIRFLITKVINSDTAKSTCIATRAIDVVKAKSGEVRGLSNFNSNLLNVGLSNLS